MLIKSSDCLLPTKKRRRFQINSKKLKNQSQIMRKIHDLLKWSVQSPDCKKTVTKWTQSQLFDLKNKKEY